jgi:hypothetical protein
VRGRFEEAELIWPCLRVGEAAEAVGREKEELAAEKEVFQREKEVCMCGWMSWGVMRSGVLDVWVGWVDV